MNAGVAPLKSAQGDFYDNSATPNAFPLCMAPDFEKTTENLVSVFVELTRLFWLRGANFIEGLPETLRYDLSKPGVVIDAAYAFKPEIKDCSNLIGIVLGDIQYTPTIGTSASGFVRSNAATDESQYSHTGKGSVVIRHIGTEPLQTMLIADQTQKLYRVFSPTIRESLGFATFYEVGRTALTEKPARLYGAERYTTDLVISFSFEDGWILKRECPKLRDIIFNAGQQHHDRVIIPPKAAH